MVRKKILSRAKKNNFKGKAKGRRVQSKRVNKKRTKRSSNKKIRKSFKKLRGRPRWSLREMRGGAALESDSLEFKLSLKSLESAKRRFALAKLSERYDIPQDPLILINDHLLNIEKVNEDEYKEIMKDIKLSPYSRSREYDWEMVYNKNNIFILIFIDERTKMIKIETMKARHDESIPRAPKGIATRVLYHMIIRAGTVVHPGYTINVTATTDESNIESLCRYYENMSFKKDPLHPREGGSQRLKTSVGEFLNNRIDDILIECIEIMTSKGIQNAEQLINTLEWRDIMRADEKQTIYNLLRELKEEIDDDDDSFSEILSSEDKTKMEDIFSLYLSGI
tara:strand:- start:481 stop:1491 length:1011 start_codon:yes stop_codon:yes gene_type:complete